MKWWSMGKKDADLERELRSDLDLEEAEQLERGLPLDEARSAARRRRVDSVHPVSVYPTWSLKRAVISAAIQPAAAACGARGS